MDGLKIVTTRECRFTPDEFYEEMQTLIDGASPRPHMSCDFMGDRLAFGVLLFPVRVYEKIEELRNGRSSS